MHRYKITYYNGAGEILEEWDNSYELVPPNNTRVTIKYNSGMIQTVGTIPVYLRACRSSGEDLSWKHNWKVDAKVYKTFEENVWISGSNRVTSGSHFIGSLPWHTMTEFEGSTYNTLALHPIDLENDTIDVYLPEVDTKNGYYSSGNIKYVTVNYGYKDSQQLSLEPYTKSTLKMNYWWSGEGDELPAPAVFPLPYNGEKQLEYRGVYTGIYYDLRSPITYQQLLADNGITPDRPSSEFTFDVTLKSPSSNIHVEEIKEVKYFVDYEFNCWKTNNSPATSSNKMNMNGLPNPNKGATIYADWIESEKHVTDTFPIWTTSEFLPCGSDPVNYVNLKLYDRPNKLFLTEKYGVYASKLGKQVAWTDGSKTYTLGSKIPAVENATYTSVWEPDDTQDPIYTVVDNLYKFGDPPVRAGYTFLGWASSETATEPEYNVGSELRVNSDTTLFGVWQARGAAKIFCTPTTCKSYQVWIYDGTKWNLYIPKVFDGTEWRIVI